MNLANDKQNYEMLGFKTVPIRTVESKAPALKGWNQSDFSWDPATTPHEGIGILTGHRSNVTVFDFDVLEKNGPVEPLARMQYDALKYFLRQRCSLIIQTQSGGLHLYFIYDPRVKQTQGLITGVDVRNDGGYVVAPPTPGYSFVKGDPSTRLESISYDDLMAQLNTFNPIRNGGGVRMTMKQPLSSGGGKFKIVKHQRNSDVCRIFGQYKAIGLSPEEALAAFDAAYEFEYGEEWNRTYLEKKIQHFWSQGVWETKPIGLREQVINILNLKGLIPEDRILKAADQVLTRVYIRRDGRLFIIDKKEDDPILLETWLSACGLDSKKKKDLIASIRGRVILNKHDKVLVDYYYYDKGNYAVYFNMADGVIKASATGITQSPAPENIRFGKAYDYRRPKETVANLVRMLNLDRARTPDELTAGLLRCWPMSVVLDLPVKTYLSIRGGHQTGKTTLAMMAAWSINPSIDLEGMSKEDLALQLSESDVAVIDNIEGRYGNEIQDMLALGATGGVIQTRKLYSDTERVRHQLSASVIFTTISGDILNRSDIASRVFSIHFVDESSGYYSEIDEKHWASVIFFDMLDHLPHVLKNMSSAPRTCGFRNVRFVSLCESCGFDIQKYKGLISDSQDSHGKKDVINDIVSAVFRLSNGSGQTGYISIGHVLKVMKSINSQRHQDRTARSFGHEFRKLMGNSLLKSKVQIDEKSHGSNFLYKFSLL